MPKLQASGAFAQALDDNARALNGAYWKVYAAGTTTQATTYSNALLTIANAWPVIGDAAGRLPDIYVAPGNYRIRVETAGGVLIAESDNNVVYGLDPGEVAVAKFKTVAQLLADETTGYSLGGDVSVIVASGDIIEAGGFRYSVLASGVTDQDMTTAGGVKLTALRDSSGTLRVDAFGAVGDGSTDDAAAIQAALDRAGRIAFGPKTYVTTAQLNLANDSNVFGCGWDTVVKITTADTSVFKGSTKSNITIEEMGFYGVASTASNGGVYLVDCANVTVRRCEFQNFSSRGVWCQGAATATKYVTVEDCYFHDWDTPVQDSAAVAFLARTQYCTANNNICDENGWHGILLQDNATDSGNTVIGHKATNNTIGEHLAYGIAAYELGGGDSWHLIQGNTINDISGGSVLGGTAGAGIYLQGCGGVRVIGNRIYNCCTTTTTETLAPAGIGVNGGGLAGELVITGNHVEKSAWYGIAVFSSVTGLITVTGNAISECVKVGVYLKNSGKVTIGGNVIRQDATATGSAIRALDTGAVARSDIAITNNTIEATFSSPVNVANAAGFVISGNCMRLSSGADKLGIVVASCNLGAITGNSMNGSLSDRHMLSLSNVTACRVSGNLFQNSNPASRELVSLAGTCTGTFIDASNYLSNALNVTNASTGGNIEVRLTAAPLVKNWVRGDRAINSAPSAGSPVAWTCVASGNPGTWASEGNL